MGMDNITFRFVLKRGAVQKNTVHSILLTEIRGTGENMYVFGELND